ncbi:MAG: PilT/PilU family type 4a pilus ATPase [Armatimonadetes bacterium]|nr:PilT/PilU family type 4a pilus ATPase [Armatimonadota bacterium]
MDINALLTRMAELGASDLYLKVPSPPAFRIAGRTQRSGLPPLDVPTVEDLVRQMLGPRELALLERDLQVDLSYSVDNVGRFRANVFRQLGRSAAVLRRIHTDVPACAELGLPDVVHALVMEARGLILITGASGSGKSTTLASMVDYRNEHSTGHIVTIEDPIEFLHADKGCLITQREVGLDVPSFHDALRAALRQTPDVLLLGEIRDLEAATAALHLAETGHLVLGSLHCTNASQTIERLVQIFPSERQAEICSLMSHNLRGILAQRLVRGKEGNLVLACEVLVGTPRVRELLRKSDVGELRETIAQGNREGMQTFDQSLYILYQQGRIDDETALANADSPNDLRLRMRGFVTAGR